MCNECDSTLIPEFGLTTCIGLTSGCKSLLDINDMFVSVIEKAYLNY